MHHHHHTKGYQGRNMMRAAMPMVDNSDNSYVIHSGRSGPQLVYGSPTHVTPQSYAGNYTAYTDPTQHLDSSAFRHMTPPAGLGGGGYGGGTPDSHTAVYDISQHVTYLPDGSKIETHSGLGDARDNTGRVNERMRGATPPHMYTLSKREGSFHGVQALRLNPVGGSDTIFGRAGLLAHTYMLGAGGDSNGCMSMADYGAFLKAYQNGQIDRVLVKSGGGSEPMTFADNRPYEQRQGAMLHHHQQQAGLRQHHQHYSV